MQRKRRARAGRRTVRPGLAFAAIAGLAVALSGPSSAHASAEATLAHATAGASGPDDRDGDLRRHLTSTFLRERERALEGVVDRGAAAVPVLAGLLGDPDHRVRALAARGLGRIGRPEARDALLEHLRREQDPRLLDVTVKALVPYGAAAWHKIRSLGRADGATPADRRAYRRFLWEYVVSLLHRILAENTDATGEFKGFYDGQFEAVAAIGPEAADVLLQMIQDEERFPITVRQFAIRAMAEAGNASHIPVLRKFHDDRVGPIEDQEFGPVDPDQVLVEYARRVLARLGDPEPCLRRIQFLERRVFEFRRRMDYDTAGNLQYKLAYEWHQVRDYSRALEEYQRYLTNYPADKLTLINSRHYAWYNMCCIASKLGHTKQALEFLAKAFEENYTDFPWLELDRDLDNIRHLPEYRALVERQKARFLPSGPPEPSRPNGK